MAAPIVTYMPRNKGTTKYEDVRKVVGPAQNSECGSISPGPARTARRMLRPLG